jgi:hypothetical protein
LSEPTGDNSSLNLCQQNNWDKSHAGSIFWMVEMMEAWFHADKEKLAEFCGDDRFNKSALAANPNVEQIPKKDPIDGLKAATRKTSKGDYFDNKTIHCPKLLESIRPDLVPQSRSQLPAALSDRSC